MHFGSGLEDALHQATNPSGGGKRAKQLTDTQRNQKIKETLSRWLGNKAADRKFRDPAARPKEG
jgi:hypothetical protein